METFVPLYISNECDSYCVMCGFNHSNSNVTRKVATIDEIREQLVNCPLCQGHFELV